MKSHFGRVLTFCLTLGLLLTVAALATDNSEQTYKVLVLNFDPVFTMADNKKQHDLVDWWNDPHWLAEQFAADMLEISHGYAQYEVAEWIDIPELPKSVNGESYSIQEYYDTLQAALASGGAYYEYSGWKTIGGGGFNFDYDGCLTQYDICNRVDKGEIDEVWIFSGPCTGVTLYETRMVGKDAYRCNSPGLQKDCRPFVVYGFNYERGVGEMLEDAGHRAESILSRIYGGTNHEKDYADFSDWEKFTAYEKVKPGKAGVGNVHFAPNSTADYDWGNKTYVYSTCNDWANYPNMGAEPQQVNCETWGNGDIRAHHKWWFSLFPHVDGVNAQSGKLNNWWVYFTLDYLSLTARGYCGGEADGKNLSWTLDNNGTLTITGTGAMYSDIYRSDNIPPWNVWKGNISNVVIHSGVTTIGFYAFEGCRNLVSVDIPDGVEFIGFSAFSSCSDLTSIRIPVSVTTIDNFAFNYCRALTDVYYSGSQTQWNQITIENHNDGNRILLNAHTHCSVAYRINSLTVTDNQENPLTAIPTGFSLAKVSITNLTDSSENNPAVCLTSYAVSGQYRGLMYVRVKASVGTTVEVTLPIDNSDGKIASLKAFAVDSFDNLIPLGNSVSFPA